MKNSVLVILGMHRSGTSLIAQWLGACGLHLGDRLLGAGTGNTEGHYEDLDFHDLHEQVFRDHGIPYGGLQAIGELRLGNYYQARMRSMVEMKNGLRRQWGWKEPRTCHFVNEYAEILGDSASYLVVYRGLDQVVNSLLRREEEIQREALMRRHPLVRLGKRFSSSQSPGSAVPAVRYAEAWIDYNRKLVEFLRAGNNCCCVALEDLLDEDGETIGWLRNTGLDLKFVPISSIYKPKLLTSERLRLDLDEDLRVRAEAIKRELLLFLDSSLYS